MDEIKDKIILVVKKAIANRAEVVDCYHDIMEIDGNDVDHIAEEVADALIAASIGDVTAHEAETEYWKTICKIESDEHHTAIKNAAEHARRLIQERDEYKHRAEVVERALFNMTKKYMLAERIIAKTKDGQLSFGERLIALFAGDAIKQAEKELAEENDDDR